MALPSSWGATASGGWVEEASDPGIATQLLKLFERAMQDGHMTDAGAQGNETVKMPEEIPAPAT